MILKTFKSNFPGLIFGLFFILLLFWLDVLLFAPKIITIQPHDAYFYDLLFRALHPNNSIWLLLISLSLIFINSMLINALVTAFDLNMQKTYLPALIYITLLSSYADIIGMLPSLLAQFFILVMLYRIMSIYNKIDDIIEVFNIGILCGLATLFYTPAIFLIVLVWLALLTMQIFSFRKWIISSIGLLVPFVFLFSILFLLDAFDIHLMLNMLDVYRFPNEIQIELNTQAYIVIIALFLLIAFAVLSEIKRLNQYIIKTRKMHVVLFWLILVIVVEAIFVKHQNMLLLFLSIPFSVLVSNFFLRTRRTRLMETTYWIWLLIILLNKLYLHGII